MSDEKRLQKTGCCGDVEFLYVGALHLFTRGRSGEGVGSFFLQKVSRIA